MYNTGTQAFTNRSKIQSTAIKILRCTEGKIERQNLEEVRIQNLLTYLGDK
jgi:hypothetical protein